MENFDISSIIDLRYTLTIILVSYIVTSILEPDFMRLKKELKGLEYGNRIITYFKRIIVFYVGIGAGIFWTNYDTDITAIVLSIGASYILYDFVIKFIKNKTNEQRRNNNEEEEGSSRDDVSEEN